MALRHYPAGPSCVFLDASREAIQIVLANCKTAGVFAQSRSSRMMRSTFCHHAGRFDLALLDPPYHHGTVAKALPQLAAHMAPGGVVLCETELDAELPEQVEGLVLAKQYKYGKILVSRYEKEEQL
ncbi:MAG: RsmD family RNA methyltransferase [Subdoligranulum sp.]